MLNKYDIEMSCLCGATLKMNKKMYAYREIIDEWVDDHKKCMELANLVSTLRINQDDTRDVEIWSKIDKLLYGGIK